MTLNAIPERPAHSLTAPAATPPAQAFLTARQLAAELGVGLSTLTTWNQRGIIPSICVGRVRRYELEVVLHALRARSSAPSTSGGNAAA